MSRKCLLNALLFSIPLYLLLFLVLPALANDPPIRQEQSQDQDQAQDQSQSQDASNSVTVIDQERAIRTVIGGASITSYANFTADCVAPKDGGFLKRGVNFFGLFGVDRAIEVSQDCLNAAHEYRMAELELERMRLEIERLRLQQTFEREVTK